MAAAADIPTHTYAEKVCSHLCILPRDHQDIFIPTDGSVTESWTLLTILANPLLCTLLATQYSRYTL